MNLFLKRLGKKGGETKLATGLSKNTAAALSYVLGPITGVVFLLAEKDSFVRFHAMQSIVVFVGLFAIDWLLGVSVIFLPVSALVGLLAFVLWLLLIYQAYQGREFEVPFAGKLARDLVKRV